MPAAAFPTFHHRDFGAHVVAGMKGETTVSVCLPARDEARTIGAIVATIRTALVEAEQVVDEILVVDDHSEDRTAAVAAAEGARVVAAADVLPELDLGPGKGEAIWKSVFAARGDVLVWCDADVRDFDARFVLGLVGPLLAEPGLSFVKGFYDRPDEGGGRVTELVARPALALLFPPLTAILQPLAGEYAARREVVESLPFARGYGVDLGLLVDAVRRFGTHAVAQVDLGSRLHRNRPLHELVPQALRVLHTALARAGVRDASEPAVLARPGHDPTRIEAGDLPPPVDVPEYERWPGRAG